MILFPAMSWACEFGGFCAIVTVFHGDKLDSWIKKSNIKVNNTPLFQFTVTHFSCHTKLHLITSRKGFKITTLAWQIIASFLFVIPQQPTCSPPIFCHFPNVRVFEVWISISEWLLCTSHCEVPPCWRSAFYSNRNVLTKWILQWNTTSTTVLLTGILDFTWKKDYSGCKNHILKRIPEVRVSM